MIGSIPEIIQRDIYMVMVESPYDRFWIHYLSGNTPYTISQIEDGLEYMIAAGIVKRDTLEGWYILTQ